LPELVEREICYDWDFHVKSFDTDSKKELRPAAVLAYNQEAGGRALDKVGLTHEFLLENGIILVFTNITVDFQNTPKLPDALHLHTWHREGKGVRFFRDTEVRNAAGELAIGTTIACCCIDPVSRKILHPEALTRFGVSKEINRQPTHRQAERIKLPKECKKQGEHIVRYTDLDYNLHMNNCFYVNLCLDYMPGGMHDKSVRYMTINYLSECIEGDIIEIYAHTQEDKAWFSGVNPRGKSFEAYFELKAQNS
jgi:acyl-ACP thioesterase